VSHAQLKLVWVNPNIMTTSAEDRAHKNLEEKGKRNPKKPWPDWVKSNLVSVAIAVFSIGVSVVLSLFLFAYKYAHETGTTAGTTATTLKTLEASIKSLTEPALRSERFLE
jgi:hypothetical protein